MPFKQTFPPLLTSTVSSFTNDKCTKHVRYQPPKFTKIIIRARLPIDGGRCGGRIDGWVFT